MASKCSLFFCGVIKLVTLFGLISFTVLPSDLSAHERALDEPSVLFEFADIPTQGSHEHSEFGDQIEHCHPALDCFAPAAFFFNPEILISQQLLQARYFFASSAGESWLLLHEAPPPRL